MRLFLPALLVLGFMACYRPGTAPPTPPPPAAPAQAETAPPPAAPAPPAETPLMLQPKPAPLEAKLLVYAPDPAAPATGTLTSIGSDSMEPLMLLWFNDFHAAHPRIKSNFICKGSATAPKALMEGTTIMGEMDAGEWTAFQAKYGYPPTRIVVAMDAIAIYVNANTPSPSSAWSRWTPSIPSTGKRAWSAPWTCGETWA
jgi:phosphate transport system substrate-binding protein